jgi:hypothetical protein
MPARLRRQRQTVHSRHIDVSDQGRDIALPQRRQRFGTAGARHRVVAPAQQPPHQNVTRQRVVVDDHDHGWCFDAASHDPRSFSVVARRLRGCCGVVRSAAAVSGGSRKEHATLPDVPCDARRGCRAAPRHGTSAQRHGEAQGDVRIENAVVGVTVFDSHRERRLQRASSAHAGAAFGELAPVALLHSQHFGAQAQHCLARPPRLTRPNVQSVRGRPEARNAPPDGGSLQM